MFDICPLCRQSAKPAHQQFCNYCVNQFELGNLAFKCLLCGHYVFVPKTDDNVAKIVMRYPDLANKLEEMKNWKAIVIRVNCCPKCMKCDC